MPRKPGLGPPILRVESLDDGREIRAKTFVDDFTQETREVIQDPREPREIMPVQARIDARNIAKHQAIGRVLNRLFTPKVFTPFKRRV